MDSEIPTYFTDLLKALDSRHVGFFQILFKNDSRTYLTTFLIMGILYQFDFRANNDHISTSDSTLEFPSIIPDITML